MKILAFDLNFSDFIIVESNISEDDITLLIDTQAEISVIRQSTIQNQKEICTNDIISIKGVTLESIVTLGTVNIELQINGLVFENTFHVVPDEFNISSDGIIGKDFLKKYSCILNFNEMFLTLHISNQIKTTISILEGPDDDTMVIPPRCEVIRHFKVNHNEDCVIHNNEVEPGVFISSTIINPKNSYIRILNINDNCTKISKKNLLYTPLSNYKIFKVDEINKRDKRSEELIEIISNRVTHENIKNKIIELCKSYSDVFALESDTMTTIDFYTQKLRIKDDEASYIKNYRLPYTQKKRSGKTSFQTAKQ